jgi:hypothetical protein
MNIGLFLQKFDYFLGIKIFNIPKFLSYVLFDFFLKKKILNKNLSNDFINKFHNEGFANLKFNNIKVINQLSDSIEKYLLLNKDNIDASKPIKISINKDTQELISSIIKKDLKDYLSNLSVYYNSELVLSEVDITRNISQVISPDTKFHLDYYLCNYFKVFIALSNVTLKCGPTVIVPKKNTKNFLNESNYYNLDSDTPDDPNYAYKFYGDKGSMLFFASSVALHRAGIPEEGFHRDMLRLTFVACPDKKENYLINSLPINDPIRIARSRSLAKPKNYRSIFKILKSFTAKPE